MTGQTSPHLILLGVAGVTWIAWTIVGDIRKMQRTGISRARYGRTIYRDKDPGRFRFRVIANMVLLLLFVTLIIGGVVSVCYDFLAGRKHADPKNPAFESLSNAPLDPTRNIRGE